jgi:hypothetical protein
MCVIYVCVCVDQGGAGSNVIGNSLINVFSFINVLSFMNVSSFIYAEQCVSRRSWKQCHRIALGEEEEEDTILRQCHRITRRVLR